MALVHSNDRAGGKSLTGNGPYTLRQRTLVGIPPFDPATHRARYRDAIENLARKNMSLGDGEVVASDLFVDPKTEHRPKVAWRLRLNHDPLHEMPPRRRPNVKAKYEALPRQHP